MVETRGGRGKAIREFLYGMFGYEHAQQALEIRASMESLFMVVTFGDMLGVPVMPPYYSLRLLPYVIGSLRPGSGARSASGNSATATTSICTGSESRFFRRGSARFSLESALF